MVDAKETGKRVGLTRKAINDIVVVYTPLALISLFTVYNTFKFSLYHWVVNFVVRMKALGGNIPTDQFSLIAFAASAIFFLWAMYRIFKMKKPSDFPILLIGLSVASLFFVTLTGYKILNLTFSMIAEEAVIMILFFILLSILSTVVIGGMKNLRTLNSGYQAVPLLIVVMAALFLWGVSLHWKLSVNIIGTTIQVAFAPILAYAFQLAKISRALESRGAGDVITHDGDGIDDHLSDGLNSDDDN